MSLRANDGFSRTLSAPPTINFRATCCPAAVKFENGSFRRNQTSSGPLQMAQVGRHRPPARAVSTAAAVARSRSPDGMTLTPNPGMSPSHSTYSTERISAASTTRFVNRPTMILLLPCIRSPARGSTAEAGGRVSVRKRASRGGLDQAAIVNQVIENAQTKELGRSLAQIAQQHS